MNFYIGQCAERSSFEFRLPNNRYENRSWSSWIFYFFRGFFIFFGNFVDFLFFWDFFIFFVDFFIFFGNFLDFFIFFEIFLFFFGSSWIFFLVTSVVQHRIE